MTAMKRVQNLRRCRRHDMIKTCASVDTYTVFVMKGDSVTLEYGIYVDPQEDEVTWTIHDYLIAKRGGYFRDICTDAQCKDRNERIRDRLKFNRNGSLTITNTTITDSGDYSISVSFGRTGSGEGFYTVVVRGVFSVDTDGVPVMEGDSATLYSGVQIKQEEWIRWYFNNNTDNIARIAGDLSYNSAIFKYDQCSDSGNERFKYRPKLEHQTASLTITDIRTSDSGLYDLLITGLHSSSSSSTSTKILIVAVDGVPAAEQQKMKRKSVKEGESVTLDPGVIKNPNNVMTWHFNDILIAEITGDQSKICTDVQCDERFRDRLKLDHQNSSLTITDIIFTDSGVYKLKISSPRFSIIRSFSVTLTGFLGFSSDGVSVFVMEGDSVSLHTDVETNQQDRIRWYFNNIRIAEIKENRSFTCTGVLCHNDGTERFRERLKLDHQTGSLTITDIRTTDSGDYELQINSNQSDNILGVSVDGVPAAERQKMKRKSVKEGESVTLDPGVIKNPNNVMTWHFNDILIAEITGDQSKICTDVQCDARFRDRLKLDHQNSSLTITDIIFTDSGVYKLKISSRRISIIRSFSVTVTAAVAGISASAVVVGVLLIIAAAAGLIYCCQRQARRKGTRRQSNDQGLIWSWPTLCSYKHDKNETSKIRLAQLNVRSMNKKAALLHDIILDGKLDFLCLCETLHHQNDCYNLNQASPPGYTFIDRPRITAKGGGLAILYKSELSVALITTPEMSSFECLVVKINGKSPVLVILIYRPPKVNSGFFSELAELLTLLSSNCSDMLTIGDINIHVDNPDCSQATNFMHVLDCFNFTQHVDFPTHKSGHILDLVCTVNIDVDQMMKYISVIINY
ncbi:uncharacterized protein LOC125248394 isoform X3 [Megalobrama amblycephala]|uniref:uncharacterized protein LOC125248394 isoform X3 n=1 Tax=Megalobrama amblycephala TaxID=75352 RepID=UPI0020144AB6|nr:uncharacterized protein LOC125248394 isoform X3 [Megalobrama amblycephala]